MATEVFPWKSAYSVGIPDIDTQHKGLVKLINDLHAAMLNGQAKETVSRIMDDLVRYTAQHFKAEEAMLKARGYSKLANHHAIHQDLTRQVMSLRDKLKQSQLSLSLEVMQFLKNWLASHILTHDMAYSKELTAVR